MPFGDIFADSQGRIEMVSADGNTAVIDSDLKKLALRIFGIPHIGMRVRAKMILKRLKPKKGDKILDAGCGIGVYANTIAKKYPSTEVFGIDIDKRKIEYAKMVSKEISLTNAKFSQGDLRKIKNKNSSFDWIICSDVLEHIEQDEQVVEEMARVLKKDGKIIFTFPNFNEFNKKNMHRYEHVRAGYVAREFVRLAEKYGLKILEKEDYSYIPGRIASELNTALLSIPALAALLFYPLYLMTRLSIKTNSPDGLFFLAKKI